MTIKHTKRKSLQHPILSGAFRMCIILCFLLFVYSSFSQAVSKRPFTSTASSDSPVMTIDKPLGIMPGDVLLVQITQHTTTLQTSQVASVLADGWVPVTETQIVVGGPTDQPGYWKKSILYHISTANDPASFVFNMDASFDLSTGSIVAFYNVDYVNGFSPNGTNAGPFDVIPAPFQIGSSTSEIYSNQFNTSSPGAGVVMFSTVCGSAQFQQMILKGNSGSDLPMEMFYLNTMNYGQGISSATGFAVEQSAGMHQYGYTSFQSSSLSSTISVSLALKPLNNNQVNNQIIYPYSHYCNTIVDSFAPQIIGQTGGHFSSESGLSLDSLTGAIIPSASIPGEYTVRYIIPASATSAGVNLSEVVNIVSPPSVNVITNRNTVCEGDTLFLSANAATNIPNNNLSFSWTGPNGFFSESSNPFVSDFNTSNAGIYTVTVMGSVLEGCSASQSTEFISSALSPIQASISGDTAVCAGNNAHLYVNISGGNAPYSILFNSGIGTMADTIQSYDGASAITRTLSNTTSFYLIGVKSVDGCRVRNLDTTPAVVQVIPALSASLILSGNNPVCRGVATSFKINITGGVVSGATFKIVYTNGTQQFVLNNYVSGAVISVNPSSSTTYQLLSVQRNGQSNTCGIIIQNASLTIIVNQPVSFADLYVSTSNPTCGGANYRSNLKINLVGGSTPYTVGITSSGTTTSFIYDTTSSIVSQRFITVRPVATTLYKITSITDANRCAALTTALGDTATVRVIPTATSNSGIYVRNSPDYRSICAGSNARSYLTIFRYTGNAIGNQQDYTNRYTVILAVKMNGVLMRYDTVRNYLNRAEIVSPTNTLWSGSLELSIVKIINSLNCATTSFNISSAPLVVITVRPAAIPGNINGSSQVCAGSNTTRIELNYYSGTIQWYRSSSLTGTYSVISGATSNVYLAQNLNATSYYKALVTNNSCNNFSAVASVLVSPAPLAGAILGTDTTCMGEDASVSLSNLSGNIMWQISYDGMQFTDMPNDTAIVLDIPAIQTSAYYRALISSGVCPSIQSDVHQIVVKDPGQWVGQSGDERWENPGNWACGRVPDSSTNVFISLSANSVFPMIGSNSLGNPDTANVHNIFIDNDAQLNIYESGVLRISGEIFGNGIIDSRDGNIEMVGTADTQRIQPSRFINHAVKTLKVANTGGVLSLDTDTDSLRVLDKIVFGTHHATLFTNDKLVLASDANATASVADMTSDGVNTGVFEGNRIIGKVIVERYIPEHYKAWQFLSAPAIGQTIKQAWQEGNTAMGNGAQGYGTIIISNVPNAVSQGFDMQSPGTSLKTYQSETNTWVGVPSTLQPIDNNKGYMLFVRGDRSVSGLNQPATSTTLRITGNLYTPIDNPPAPVNVAADRFEAVGNPYASAVDFSKIQKTGGLQDAFYVWDPRLTNTPNGNYGFGAYQTFVGMGDGNYRVIPGGGSYGNPGILQRGYIQSGQAFFVRASGTDGTLQFTESSKVAGSAVVTRLASSTASRLSVNLSHLPSANNSVLLDGAFLDLDSSYFNGIDRLDIPKILNSSENLSIVCQGVSLVSDRRALQASEDTVWLSLGQLRARNYRFDISPEYLDGIGRDIRIYDTYTQTFTNINPTQKTSIDFSVNNTASAQSNRFCIIFSGTRVTLPVKITQISALRKSDDVLVSWRTAQEVMMEKYIVEKSNDGKHFLPLFTTNAKNLSGPQYYTVTDRGVDNKALFYRIKAVEASQNYSYSEIVSVSGTGQQISMEVFPNPVTNHIVHLIPTGIKPGNLKMSLLDMNGKKVYTCQVSYNGQHSIDIKLPETINTGTYQLSIYSDNFPVQSISVGVR